MLTGCRTSLRASRVVLVRSAIAIVVETVTKLGLGRLIAITDNRAIGTRRCPGRTDARKCRRAGHTGAGTAVVDGAITVVVFAVADFSGGRAGRARNVSTAARGIAFRAFTHLTGCRTGHVAARVAVIDSAVAIVVLVVANLGRCRRRLCTNERPSGTRKCAHRTNTLLTTNRTLTAATGIAVVDGAIAVVVDIVARFD